MVTEGFRPGMEWERFSAGFSWMVLTVWDLAELDRRLYRGGLVDKSCASPDPAEETSSLSLDREAR